MTVRQCLLAFPALLLLAASAQAQDKAPASTAPAASSAPASSAPVAKTADDGTIAIGAPPDGKAQVVFYRPSATGMLIGCTVHDGDPEISHLANGKYFIQVVDPGVHEFWVKSEVKDTLKLEVEAGETYYVKCSIAMGIMVGRPNLSPADKPTFDRKSKGLKLQKAEVPKESAAKGT